MRNRVAEFLDDQSEAEAHAVVDEAARLAELVDGRIKFALQTDGENEVQFEAEFLAWYVDHRPLLVMADEPLAAAMARELRRLGAQILRDADRLEGGAV